METLVNSIKTALLGTVVSILIIAASAKYIFPETFRTLDIITRNHIRRTIPMKYLSYTDRVKRVIGKIF